MAEFVEVMKQRDRMHKYYGKDGGGCYKCPISAKNNGTNRDCHNFLEEHPEEARQIIVDWAKEHPTMTNADKAREVLGLSKDEVYLSGCGGIKCPYPPGKADACRNCSRNGFWQQEWKDPKELENG